MSKFLETFRNVCFCMSLITVGSSLSIVLPQTNHFVFELVDSLLEKDRFFTLWFCCSKGWNGHWEHNSFIVFGAVKFQLNSYFKTCWAWWCTAIPRRGGSRQISGIKGSLVYRSNSITAKATEEKPCQNKQTNRKLGAGVVREREMEWIHMHFFFNWYFSLEFGG